MQQTIGEAVTPGNSRVVHEAGSLTVLHVTAPATVGGLERVVLALSAGHVTGGHQVHVACVVTPDHADHPLFDLLAVANVTVHPIVVPARSYSAERAQVAELCKSLRPDVVHTHGYRPDVIDSGVARKLGIPTVSTVHGFIYGKGRGRVYEWLQRKSLRKCDAVVAVSRKQIPELVSAGVANERIHWIRNAWGGSHERESRIAARRKLGVAAGSFHVGWIGRISREKGADVLISALRHLADVPCETSIIGQGRERAALELEASQLPTPVHWHGLVPSAEALLPAFDVVVLSSRTEGTPMVLLEAMAASVPVVATAVGGVPDVVSNEEALLVPSENPAALAAAIRNVYDNPTTAAARAAKAHDRLLHEFALEPWLDRYEQLYRRLRSSLTARRRN